MLTEDFNVTRDDIPFGSVMLCSKDDELGRFIQCVEHPSVYSHSGLWDGENLVHSRGMGVAAESLHLLMKEKKEADFIDVYEPVGEWADAAGTAIKEAHVWVDDELSNPSNTIFDLKDLMLAGMVAATHEPERATKCLRAGLVAYFINLEAFKAIGEAAVHTPEENRLSCAEFVTLCYDKAGTPLYVNPAAANAPPNRKLDEAEYDELILQLGEGLRQSGEADVAEVYELAKAIANEARLDQPPDITRRDLDKDLWPDWRESLLRFLLHVMVEKEDHGALKAFVDLKGKEIEATGSRVRFVSPGMLRDSRSLQLVGRIVDPDLPIVVP